MYPSFIDIKASQNTMDEKDLQARDNKINYLLQLVDDPDEEVYETVAKEFLVIGEEALEHLEHLWEVTFDNTIQKRIEHIIHQVQLEGLLQKWKDWYQNNGSILDALILTAKFRFPSLNEYEVRKQYAKLKQDIWLELNNYLTPLEQINVINGIYFNYYNISGTELHKSNEHSFYINKLFETKKGNSYSNGALLAAVLEELDVPLRCVQLPHQFLLGYFETIQPFFKLNEENSIMKLVCYMDTNNGYVYTQRDIDNYFKKIGEDQLKEHFLPLHTDQLIQIYLQELQYFLDQNGSYDAADEIGMIIKEVFKSNKET